MNIEDKEKCKDNIVTLMTESGQQVEFVEIAGIAHQGKFYAILQPVELLPGMMDDEALVFRVSRGADDSDRFEIELDDETIKAVFEKYEALLAKAGSDSGGDY